MQKGEDFFASNEDNSLKDMVHFEVSTRRVVRAGEVLNLLIRGSTAEVCRVFWWARILILSE